MTDEHGIRCKACDGTGMLEDEDKWKYECTVCKGTGYVMPGTSTSKDIEVDDNNRILE